MLADDLARRDFTVNAMALRFDPPELIDLYGGARDLQLQLIRVLHDNSFRDDATRSLRAIRYAARLRFGVESETASWLRRDLGYVEPVSGPRLRRELALLFGEDEAVYGAVMGRRLGLLEAVHPSFDLPDEVAMRWRDALDAGHFAETDELGFCVLIGMAEESQALSASRRLHLAGRFEAAMLDTVRLRAIWPKLALQRDDPPEAVETLERFHDSAVWATAVLAGGDAGLTCNRYLEYWQHIRPYLRGEELMSLGVASGVAMGDMMRALKRARLAGQAPDREAEIALVHEMLGRRGG
jgi:tRNA nucleotidyltransferase (CCA-adding enzyme)